MIMRRSDEMNRNLPRLIILAAGMALVPLTFLGCDTLPDYRDPATLAQLIDRKNTPYVLVDVRTPDEYASGHIPTAINIPLDQITRNLPSPDRSRLVIVYCASGARASSAAKKLQSLGFTRVLNFGGIDRWEGALETSEE